MTKEPWTNNFFEVFSIAATAKYQFSYKNITFNTEMIWQVSISCRFKKMFQIKVFRIRTTRGKLKSRETFSLKYEHGISNKFVVRGHFLAVVVRYCCVPRAKFWMRDFIFQTIYVLIRFLCRVATRGKKLL